MISFLSRSVRLNSIKRETYKYIMEVSFMKILAFNGSPRKKRNTGILLQMGHLKGRLYKARIPNSSIC